jgi:hypothetical protein
VIIGIAEGAKGSCYQTRDVDIHHPNALMPYADALMPIPIQMLSLAHGNAP